MKKIIIDALAWLAFYFQNGFQELLYGLVRLFGYRKKVVLKNYHHAFGTEQTFSDSEGLTGFYRYFARMVTETLASRYYPKNAKPRLVFKNPEVLHQLIDQYPRVLVLTGHFGNWELILDCGAVEFKERTFLAVYQPLADKAVDEWFHDVRAGFGVVPVPHKNIIRRSLKEQSNHCIALVMDQAPAEGMGGTGKFLNFETRFHLGGYHLATKLKAPMVFVTSVWKGDRYESVFYPIGDVQSEEEFTTVYAGLLSQTIREAPFEYLWSHKRFKRELDYTA